jgi:hypothetical protein
MVDPVENPTPTSSLSLTDKAKIYFAEVVIGKVAPSAVAALLAAGAGFLLAHQGILEQWGITYFTWPLAIDPTDGPPSGPCLLIEFATLSAKTVSVLGALAVGLVTILLHHTQATFKGTPQTGAQRSTDTKA